MKSIHYQKNKNTITIYQRVTAVYNTILTHLVIFLFDKVIENLKYVN